jgi:hypothetical protein
MSALLSSITGSSGGFLAKFSSLSVNIASGVTGDLVILTPPAGQKVRLTGLFCSSADIQADISIDINNVNITPNGTVVPFDNPSLAPGSAIQVGGLLTGHLEGKVNEEIKIIKGAGNTTQPIIFSYQFGV